MCTPSLPLRLHPAVMCTPLSPVHALPTRTHKRPPPRPTFPMHTTPMCTLSFPAACATDPHMNTPLLCLRTPPTCARPLSPHRAALHPHAHALLLCMRTAPTCARPFPCMRTPRMCACPLSRSAAPHPHVHAPLTCMRTPSSPLPPHYPHAHSPSSASTRSLHLHAHPAHMRTRLSPIPHQYALAHSPRKRTSFPCGCPSQQVRIPLLPIQPHADTHKPQPLPLQTRHPTPRKAVPPTHPPAHHAHGACLSQSAPRCQSCDHTCKSPGTSPASHRPAQGAQYKVGSKGCAVQGEQYRTGTTGRAPRHQSVNATRSITGIPTACRTPPPHPHTCACKHAAWPPLFKHTPKL
jgi:hypothetical protein